MKIKSSLIQTQRPILAQVMQQSISILMLSSVELNAAIEQELQTNPLLEAEPVNVNSKDLTITDIQKSLNHLSEVPYQGEFSDAENQDDEFLEPALEQIESLEDHLLRQLRLEITDPIELKIGELIIGNLNAEGYLATSLLEIAQSIDLKDEALLEKVLKRIQLFDPIASASRNLEECLLIQLSVSDSPHRRDAEIIVQAHFNDLCHKRHELIAQKEQMTLNRVKDAAQLISSLDPKPARNYQTFDQVLYAQADIFVYKNPEGDFKIELNRKDTPLIRINPVYRKLLNDPGISDDERKFVQEKLTNAVNFIKSIQQRGETIVNIVQFIVDRQTAFFEGDTSSLAPMTLRDIAEKLDRNESTISRAIHNKYMDTPQGVFSLKFFFSQAVNDANQDLSSYNVKEEIKSLVDSEDKASPLSDSHIQEHFNKKGVKLARRTINKYRQELNIPPSHLRKESQQ